MALSNAERQRHKGKPRGNAKLMAELATLRARVAELEAAATHRAPVVELTTPARRLRAEMAALQKERDDLAESLAQIEAYQPGILNVAKAWLASIDRTARGAADDSEWPERN
jgi:chromosome segregation ATPase